MEKITGEVVTLFYYLIATMTGMSVNSQSKPPHSLVWFDSARLRLCPHRVALNGAIDMVELSKMLKTLELLQHFISLFFTFWLRQR